MHQCVLIREESSRESPRHIFKDTVSSPKTFKWKYRVLHLSLVNKEEMLQRRRNLFVYAKRKQFPVSAMLTLKLCNVKCRYSSSAFITTSLTNSAITIKMDRQRFQCGNCVRLASPPTNRIYTTQSSFSILIPYFLDFKANYKVRARVSLYKYGCRRSL